jgi:hypothetical protein
MSFSSMPGSSACDRELLLVLREVDSRRVARRGTRRHAGAVPELVEQAVEIAPAERRDRYRVAAGYVEVGGQHGCVGLLVSGRRSPGRLRFERHAVTEGAALGGVGSVAVPPSE